MKAEGDKIVLSNGHGFYAHRSILGLSASGETASYEDEKSVAHGYDGTVGGEEFTPEERREIALHMIGRWKEWGGL